MIRRKVLPILAGVGIVIALAAALTSQSKSPPPPPAAEPPEAPYENYLSGAGLVEASTDNINIGTPLPGVANKVYVKVGQKVRPGDPLFELDDREHRADFEIRQGNLLKAEAAIVEARASLQDAEDQYDLVKNIADSRAVSIDDVRKRQDAVLLAEARVSSAKAAAIAGEAEVRAARTNLDRLMVRSPIAGEILQVAIHPGEYVLAGGSATPPIRMGNLDTLHVRVDIDENDAWRFKPGTKAIAFIRGNRDLKVDLAFVRVEPYITPKMSLTGSSTERVDTRVLQILYRFERSKLPVFVGQQVDVYIDTGTNARKGNDAATPAARG
jgi:HlyD family secretion protein